MLNISLKNIKQESINAVFSVISHGGNVSRAEISEKTGLSLMTVGKVADMLLEKNIIVQSKQITHEVGRRAGLVNLNNENRMAIFDLSSYNFKLNIFDSALDFIDSYVYTYCSDCSFEENLFSFLSESKRFAEKSIKRNYFVGTAVSTPGAYYKESDSVKNTRITELNNVKIKETFVKYFGQEPMLIGENVKFGAIPHIRRIEDNRSKILFYLHIGESVAGAIAINGELVQSLESVSGEVGHMFVNNASGGIIVDDFVSSPDFPKDEKRRLIINIVHNAIWLLGPHTVIIESDDEEYYISSQDVINTFNYQLREFPEVLSLISETKNEYIGAGLLLRDKWLERLVY